MNSAAAIIPIIVIGLAFVIFCLRDVFTRPRVKYLPRWLWAIICLISVPLGGIIYLIVGRGEEPVNDNF
jgi:Phospholipase_D-nuclease N-terminal